MNPCTPASTTRSTYPTTRRVADADDADLRADVRRVAALLGESLVRQQGQHALELVEQVRTLTKQSKEHRRRRTRGRGARAARRAAASTPPRCWCAPSPTTSTWPTSPSRCTGCAAARPAADARLAGARGRRVADEKGADALTRGDRAARGASGVHRAPDRGEPPLDPDQAAPGRRRPGRADRRPSRPRARRQDRELAEIIDLIWQTDELRQHRPTPLDEARNVVYYLQDLVDETLPGARRPTSPPRPRGTARELAATPVR